MLRRCAVMPSAEAVSPSSVSMFQLMAERRGQQLTWNHWTSDDTGIVASHSWISEILCRAHGIQC